MAAKKASAKSRKVVKKKPASKAVTVKKAPTIKAPTMKAPPIKDALSKGAMIKAIMDMTGLAKKDVTHVFESFTTLIELHVKARGPGKFVMPGLLKITVVKKAARPARKGINPFTGEEVMFKAKPAHKVVKIKALKKLKEQAA
jgi:nucleoid DNA-binding protein